MIFPNIATNIEEPLKIKNNLILNIKKEKGTNFDIIKHINSGQIIKKFLILN